jgi:hypothetical protein
MIIGKQQVQDAYRGPITYPKTKVLHMEVNDYGLG